MEKKFSLPLKYIAFIFFASFVFGCGSASVVSPIQGIKQYIVSKEQTYSYPMNQVMAAFVLSLKNSGFLISSIESFNKKTRIRARWQDINVNIMLFEVTPAMTKAKGRIIKAKGSREFSIEKGIFDQTQRILDQNRRLDWNQLTAGMVKVYKAPNENSEVLAYFGTGAYMDIIKDHGTWAEVYLMDGVHGYVIKKYIKPVPEPTLEE